MGYESLMLLIATAYFAGIRLSAPTTRYDWDAVEGILRLYHTGKPLEVLVRKGAKNVTMSFENKIYQLQEAEHAGFIVQGKEPPV